MEDRVAWIQPFVVFVWMREDIREIEENTGWGAYALWQLGGGDLSSLGRFQRIGRSLQVE